MLSGPARRPVLGQRRERKYDIRARRGRTGGDERVGEEESQTSHAQGMCNDAAALFFTARVASTAL